jgi:hypothetical protein
MRHAGCLLCAIAVVNHFCTDTPSRAAEAADASPEQKVLDRQLGNWLHTCTQLKSEWTPNETQNTVAGSYTRILSGRFVQGNCRTSDGQTFLQLDTYDAQRKCYRRWLFHSNGQTSEHIGKWNADEKSMTWSGSVGGNLTSTQIDRYIGTDTLEFSVLIKDPDGKVYYQIKGKSVRTD